MSLYSHYDRDADIVLIRLQEADGTAVVSEEIDGGLRDLDERDGRLVGLELWEASTRLPADLLALLSSPGAAAA